MTSESWGRLAFFCFSDREDLGHLRECREWEELPYHLALLGQVSYVSSAMWVGVVPACFRGPGLGRTGCCPPELTVESK